MSVHETTEDGESLLSLACSAGYYELAQVKTTLIFGKAHLFIHVHEQLSEITFVYAIQACSADHYELAQGKTILLSYIFGKAHLCMSNCQRPLLMQFKLLVPATTSLPRQRVALQKWPLAIAFTQVDQNYGGAYAINVENVLNRISQRF